MIYPGCSAIVLAGGQSRRMGRDKALLEVNGRAFLEHVIATMQVVSDDVVLVTDRADRYVLPHVRVVVDMFADAGPVAGIVTGLIHAGTGTHWVVPCDMPFLSPNVLQLLHDACEPEWDAVVPEINGEPEPLVAIYRDTALPKLRSYLENGRRSARGALTELKLKRIGEEALRYADPALASFQNINTPQELANFMQATQRLS